MCCDQFPLGSAQIDHLAYQKHTVCVGVAPLTYFIVHVLAPEGQIFSICGSRTLWDDE